MASKNLWLWKSPETAADEVSLGEIVHDRFGSQTRHEYLVLHVDTMLALFDVNVYREVAALTPEDDPIPIRLSIGAGETSRARLRSFVQSPSATDRRQLRLDLSDRRA